MLPTNDGTLQDQLEKIQTAARKAGSVRPPASNTIEKEGPTHAPATASRHVETSFSDPERTDYVTRRLHTIGLGESISPNLPGKFPKPIGDKTDPQKHVEAHTDPTAGQRQQAGSVLVDGPSRGKAVLRPLGAGKAPVGPTNRPDSVSGDMFIEDAIRDTVDDYAHSGTDDNARFPHDINPVRYRPELRNTEHRSTRTSGSRAARNDDDYSESDGEQQRQLLQLLLADRRRRNR